MQCPDPLGEAKKSFTIFFLGLVREKAQFGIIHLPESQPNEFKLCAKKAKVIVVSEDYPMEEIQRIYISGLTFFQKIYCYWHC